MSLKGTTGTTMFKKNLNPYVCNICGRDFGNNIKSRDNYNVHLKL